MKNLFYIDEKSGTIMARVAFDHEEMQNIPFTVTAVDGGDPALSTSVPVLVKVGILVFGLYIFDK